MDSSKTDLCVIDIGRARESRELLAAKTRAEKKHDHVQILLSDALTWLRSSAPEVAEASLASALEVRTACNVLSIDAKETVFLVECAQLAYIGLGAVNYADRDSFFGAAGIETSIALLSEFGLERHAQYIATYRESFDSGVDGMRLSESLLCAALALFERKITGMPAEAAAADLLRLRFSSEIVQALTGAKDGRAYKTA